MIAGVKIKQLHDLMNDQGGVQHMLRADDPEFFCGFGEIYFSIINPAVIKGWHTHHVQVSVLSCVSGRVQLAVHRDGETAGIDLGDGQRKLVLIPPGVTYGWKNLGETPAIIANCASRPHDPAESTKMPLESIPFRWS